MDIKKYIKKNIALLVVLAIFLFVGAGFIVFAENQINSQKAQIVSLQKTIKNNGDQIGVLSSENTSKSAQIQALLNQPKPTPIVQPAVQLPEWCAGVIDGWMNGDGYSRSETNQMMKRDHPECAY